MPTIQIQVQGLDQASQYLRQVMASVKDRTRLMRQVGQTLDKWIDTNFAAGGAEHKWAPLAASTVFARRQGRGLGGAQPLRNTGLLRASHSFVATADRVVVGFPENSVAGFQHFGTPGPYTIAARNAKALAFPYPMWMNAGRRGPGANVIVRRKAGSPVRGRVTSKRATQLGYKIPKGRGDLQAMLIVKSVQHPGLVARPLLPTIPLAEQIVQQAARDYVQLVVDKLGTV